MRHFWLFFVPLCSVLLSFHGFHTCAKPPVVERKLWVADVGWGGHRLCLQYWPPKLATCVAFFARSYKLLVKPLRHPKRKYCKNHLYPVLKDTVYVCSIGLPSSQPASLFLRVPTNYWLNLSDIRRENIAKIIFIPYLRTPSVSAVLASQARNLRHFLCTFLQIIGWPSSKLLQRWR